MTCHLSCVRQGSATRRRSIPKCWRIGRISARKRIPMPRTTRLAVGRIASCRELSRAVRGPADGLLPSLSVSARHIPPNADISRRPLLGDSTKGPSAAPPARSSSPTVEQAHFLPRGADAMPPRQPRPGSDHVPTTASFTIGQPQVEPMPITRRTGLFGTVLSFRRLSFRGR
jgi:hypothetical protein